MTPPRLIAISPGRGGDLDPWLATLAAAGVDAALIREPRGARWTTAPLPLIRHARTTPWTGPAAGLHLPGDRLPPGTRADGWVGVSCHDAASVDAALAAGAAYVFLSPVWAPTSKEAASVLGPERFLAVAAGRPVLALGGITPERAAALVAAGAHGVAVLGGFDGATVDEARRYVEAVSPARR